MTWNKVEINILVLPELKNQLQQTYKKARESEHHEAVSFSRWVAYVMKQGLQEILILEDNEEV